MHYVYLLESENNPKMFYVGQTHDLKQRLAEHNTGKSVYTRRNKPWRLVWYSGFLDKSTALVFESYLKTGSGKTFFRRHFIQTHPKTAQ